MQSLINFEPARHYEDVDNLQQMQQKLEGLAW